MKNFDAFNPVAWLDGILTVWGDTSLAVEEVEVARKPRYTTRRLFSTAAIVVSLSAGVQTAVSALPETAFWSSVAGGDVRDVAPEVPSGYWPRLVSKMSTWPVLVSDDTDLPEPIV